MKSLAARAIAAGVVGGETFVQFGMAYRFTGRIGDQILLRHIRDIFRLRILGEQMIKRLVLGRANVFGDRLIPFVGVAEGRVDVEHDAAERKDAVAYDLADAVLRLTVLHGDRTTPTLTSYSRGATGTGQSAPKVGHN